jgi:hypothetical protein
MIFSLSPMMNGCPISISLSIYVVRIRIRFIKGSRWSFQVIGHTTLVVYSVWVCVRPCTYVPGVSTYVGGLTVGSPDTRVLFC